MGSLMPGWNSFPDSTEIMRRSKSSLTKEEIEAYWRLKKQQIESFSKDANDQNANRLPTISETKLMTTTALALDGIETQEVVIEWPQPTASSPDWWTRSNWAYLNDTPKILDYPGHPYIIRQEGVTTPHYNRSISSAV